MEVAPERWPEEIRKFVDAKAGDAESLTVSVKAAAMGGHHVWHVELGCTCCKLARFWNFIGPAPLPDPNESTPLPGWVGLIAQLDDVDLATETTTEAKA